MKDVSFLPEAMQKLIHENRVDTKHKFAPKLNPMLRRQIKALLLLEFPISQIAAHFNLHRQTVALMARANSSVYRDVRDEAVGMGERDFIQKYLPHDVLAAFVNTPTPTVARMVSEKTAGMTVNPRANKFAGDQWIRTTRIRIEFLEEGHQFLIDNAEHGFRPGWYYWDYDEEMWFGGADATSKMCLDRADGEIV